MAIGTPVDVGSNATPAVQPDRRAVLLLHVASSRDRWGSGSSSDDCCARAIVHAPYDRTTFVIGAETLGAGSIALVIGLLRALRKGRTEEQR